MGEMFFVEKVTGFTPPEVERMEQFLELHADHEVILDRLEDERIIGPKSLIIDHVSAKNVSINTLKSNIAVFHNASKTKYVYIIDFPRIFRQDDSESSD